MGSTKSKWEAEGEEDPREDAFVGCQNAVYLSVFECH